jgi:UDPglucose 6-dehydrogenase
MPERVGVIGLGHLGAPLFKALKRHHEAVSSYDKYKESDEWEDILKTDIVFICVPTNSGESGRLDMSIVESVMDKLAEDGYEGTVVIKSTLGLGFIEGYLKRTDLRIVVYPDWLREATAFQDTLEPDLTVIGGPEELVDETLEACSWIDKESANVVEPGEAVLIKLAANALATTKISFANQIMMIAENHKIDADAVMKVLMKDPRTSPLYLKPGREYSGYCLPKDVRELSNQDQDVLFTAVEKVNEIMKNRLKKK